MATTEQIELKGPNEGRSIEVLTPEALAFVGRLQREFGDRRLELLQRRDERHARGTEKTQPAEKKVALLPGFLIGFVVLAALNGFDLVAKPIASVLTEASKWLLVISVPALGIKTSVREMMAVGTTAIGLIAAETIFLALVVLSWITLVGGTR